jgi:hypothetical protein
MQQTACSTDLPHQAQKIADARANRLAACRFIDMTTVCFAPRPFSLSRHRPCLAIRRVLLNAGRVLTGGFMYVTLSDDEVVTLRGLLQDYLPELKWEVARTELKDFRHILVQRQTLCERLIDELSEVPTRE